MKDMRGRIKKEEDSRRHYQEFARKKDEEIKSLKTELTVVEGKYKEESNARTREKTLLMQRDNKIAVLEGKLNGVPVATPKPSALKNVPKQREITGRITKASESAEK